MTAAGAGARGRPRSDAAALTDGVFDLVVVGGGIYGAFAAWDAALRGLRVALVERGDFGGGTSANSLKIVHGGLRYLQSLDLPRLRESVRERAILLHAAPHLVRPLPCLLPTRGWGVHGRPALAAALVVNDLASVGRNRSREPSRRLPRGHTMGPAEYRRLAGVLAVTGATGGALWYDGVMTASERLTLSVVRAAAAAGARVVNHTPVTALLRDGARVTGVRVRDADGRETAVRARLVLNAAGPWAPAIAALAGSTLADAFPPAVLACNVVVRRGGPNVAAALPLPRERRMLFAVPWREHLMIGTSYRAISGAPDAVLGDTARDAERLVRDATAAAPALDLDIADVALVHAGLLPGRVARGVAAPLDRPLLVDHGVRHGVPGLVSVQGVKWTTARAVAERAVSLCQRLLGRQVRVGGTDVRPVFGGDIGALDAFWTERPADIAVSEATLRRLKELYGSAYRDVLALAAADPALAAPLASGSPAIGAEVAHAVRAEWARGPADVLRRTELGATGAVDAALLAAVARIVAAERGGPAERRPAQMARTP